jgi:transposase
MDKGPMTEPEQEAQHVDPYADLEMESLEVGPIPVLRHFFDRLGLDELLEQFVPEKQLGRRPKMSHARALSLMVKNVLTSREPLYGVPEWLDKHVPDHFGLGDEQASRLMNDDRIGRALDRLYELDPASLMTAVVMRAVKEFGIDLSQIHNDTTTVTFSGGYEGQEDKEAKKRPPLITFGHNKDHRPDLKQLVYSLTVSADGAVPVHYKTYDGNVTDDKTHIETWKTIREIAGTAEFLYVADSKLCTRENLGFIAEQGGTFITVLPRSRHEDDAFRQRAREHRIPWQEVRRSRNPRGKDKPDQVYEAHEPRECTSEGYRLIWFRSSVKRALDEKQRANRISRAKMRIENLENRRGAHRFRTIEKAEKAAADVLQDEGAQRWLRVRVEEVVASDFKQSTPGRPGKNTKYKKVDTTVILFEVEELADVIHADALCDGLFAMVTNVEDRTAAEILAAYKYQPFLEKRNEQLKSVLSVAPILLKNPKRVAALLFVYFLAVLVFALIEREVRRAMQKREIASIPLYPEGRPCKAPTTDGILSAFLGLRRTQLLTPDGAIVRTFHDPLRPVVAQLLEMMRVDPAHYGV